MFRPITLSAGIALAATLAACSPQTGTQQTSGQQGAAAQPASVVASADNSEFHQYQITYAAAERQGYGCDADDGCAARADEMVAEARRHLIAAVNQGDHRAADFIATNAVSATVWHETSAGIIKRADSMLGSHDGSAAVWMMLAGYLTAHGDYVPRNYDRATLYYASAWLAGENDASARAANIYYASNDLVNAYLWSLRCTDGCSGLDMSRTDLESSLDSPTIKLVQSKASDRSVLGL
ncbi:hypothetical protein [Paraburkholderia phytofirmans]|uniref:Lipoprotein n=1 Tax=Paraburkholderia phytofirmans (strain DSM 17436 / LMG 22146 / PsJN) TaxID=398527 RepID=B2THA8_PARPJ|nr:hypothetical protein [Paraburkholderia phytofirmans]ACD21654.1 conserved hypothetical protein [Paraburkholderia phytofirmans PsJN]